MVIQLEPMLAEENIQYYGLYSQKHNFYGGIYTHKPCGLIIGGIENKKLPEKQQLVSSFFPLLDYTIIN